MIIVQTFWSGEKDLMMDSYGWLSPKYHLMAWTLSCLTLKENYEDVILYTDSKGYEVFHKHLQLPYKKTVLQYDNLICNKELWAYPKLLTYSIQDKPFVHVDGDVFLPNGLPEETQTDGLIAQNFEIGTGYYKAMANQILKKPIVIPDFWLKELEKDSISSYNAGVLGGHDLKFIKEYCDTAFQFIAANNLTDINNKEVNVNYNIVFEQVLFYCLASGKNKKVATVLDYPVNDNGYTYADFCDFNSFHKTKLMHIIGGHKRNPRICELMGRILLNKYPEYYQRIMQLFPAEYTCIKREGEKVINLHPIFNLQKNIQPYKEFFCHLFLEWSKIEYEELFEQEKRSGNYFQFPHYSFEEQNLTLIKRNPYASIYEIPQEWDAETRAFLKDKLSRDYPCDHFDIVCIPDLSCQGYKEILINNVCYNLWLLLLESKTLGKIIEEIMDYFPSEVKNTCHIRQIVLMNLEYLFYHKIIYMN